MKIFVVTFLYVLLPVLLLAQITFSQGYMVVGDDIDVFSDINYSLNLKDSVIYLPHKSVRVDSMSVLGKIEDRYAYTIYLHDGDHAYYTYSPSTGSIFSILWTNGRLMLWENKLPSFKIEK